MSLFWNSIEKSYLNYYIYLPLVHHPIGSLFTAVKYQYYNLKYILPNTIAILGSCTTVYCVLQFKAEVPNLWYVNSL